MGNFSIRITQVNEKGQSVGSSEDAECPEAIKISNVKMVDEEEFEWYFSHSGKWSWI